MKTLNNHPLWYNEPLRLNEEQTRNPALIFDEFFQCYHLNEVRQTMWQWLVTLVICESSVCSDPHERNNYLYFYEQIEMVMEGVWVMRRGNNKVPVSNISAAKETKITHNPRFTKPERLIEKVNEHPQ